MKMKAPLKNDETVKTNRGLLLDAFAALRQRGFFARANYLCCSSCGFSALQVRFDELTPEEKSETKGFVFWHSQNEDDIWARGEVNLAFGSFSGFDEDEKVGKEIVSVLESFGLHPEWDENPARKILVPLKESK